jgi:putative transposase
MANNELSFTAQEIAEMTGKSRQATGKRAKKESWPRDEENGKGRNGKTNKYPLATLPSDVQESILIYIKDTNAPSAPETTGKILTLLPALRPSAAIMAMQQLVGPSDFEAEFGGSLTNPVAVMTPEEKRAHYEKLGPGFAALMKPEVQRKARIVEEALAVPGGWGSDKWVQHIAEKYEISRTCVYRYIGRHKKKGLCGLDHTKKNKGEPKAWTPEALNHWIGLCVKREHRKINKKSLYLELQIEANRRGWRIGGLGSGLWQLRNYPNLRLLEAYSKGGARGLDNALPPILRDYSDLAPFECLVGDQHRKNRWVVDDFTGEVIRIEAYVWQDLRTRIIYGGACARHYDAFVMGLALRMGMRIYGAFGSVYNDNGKPEISLYFKGILKMMQHYGLQSNTTIALPTDLLDVDPEEVYPAREDPRMQRLAIVQNAKAKMIEGTWRVLDDIATSVFLLPGNTKTLTDDIHTQDMDQKELKKLADKGQLPLMSQYLITFYKALNYYNREKPHRGVAKEWRWPNKPRTVTPYDCLMKCHDDGWRPRRLSDEAINLLFMAEENRTINRGHIAAFNDTYTHDDLLQLHGKRIRIRYDLVDQGSLMVFDQGNFICIASPIEYSSMKDTDLAKKKIMQKRARAREITEIYNSLARPVDDIRTFAPAEQAEQVAALVTAAKEKKQSEYREMNRAYTQAELDAEVAKLAQGMPLPTKTKRLIPERPGYFLDDRCRFDWIKEVLKAGGAFDAADETFKEKRLAGMSQGERDYYDFEMTEYAEG